MDGSVDGRMTMIAAGECEIVVSRDFKAPRASVLDAMLDPVALRRWLSGPSGWSLDVCEVEKRTGGRYRFVWKNKHGDRMGTRGIYREYDPPSRVVNTQTFDEDWTGGEVVGTFVVRESAGKTHMTHTLRYPSREARDAVLASPTGQGMAHGYALLDGYLARAEASSASSRKLLEGELL
jgi:uncharacterized protein YndB with AHSA1/START domain